MTDTPTCSPGAVERVVDAFLAAVAGGEGIPEALYAADATLDATVPNWRWTTRGAAAVAAEYGRWFADPATFEELERQVRPDGAVLRYLLSWTEQGVPHAAHHCHLLRIDEQGRIAGDVVFCGGRWDAALLAQMGEVA